MGVVRPKTTSFVLGIGPRLAAPFSSLLINDLLTFMSLKKNNSNNSLLLKYFLIGSYKKLLVKSDIDKGCFKIYRMY